MRATLFRDKLASVLKGQSQLMAIVSNMQTLNGFAKTKLKVLAINWGNVPQKVIGLCSSLATAINSSNVLKTRRNGWKTAEN